MNEFFGELSMNIEIENSGVVYYRYRWAPFEKM